MRYAVRELHRAKADKRQIFEWLYEHSHRGAAAWLAAYDRTVESLKTRADSFSEADENAELESDVRQALFKTRRGRVYRVLFMIEQQEVFILRVRGPGQEPVDTDAVAVPEPN